MNTLKQSQKSISDFGSEIEKLPAKLAVAHVNELGDVKVFVYLDDIVIFWQAIREHDENLRRVLEALTQIFRFSLALPYKILPSWIFCSPQQPCDLYRNVFPMTVQAWFMYPKVLTILRIDFGVRNSV